MAVNVLIRSNRRYNEIMEISLPGYKIRCRLKVFHKIFNYILNKRKSVKKSIV